MYHKFTTLGGVFYCFQRSSFFLQLCLHMRQPAPSEHLILIGWLKEAWRRDAYVDLFCDCIVSFNLPWSHYCSGARRCSCLQIPCMRFFCGYMGKALSRTLNSHCPARLCDEKLFKVWPAHKGVRDLRFYFYVLVEFVWVRKFRNKAESSPHTHSKGHTRRRVA